MRLLNIIECQGKYYATLKDGDRLVEKILPASPLVKLAFNMFLLAIEDGLKDDGDVSVLPKWQFEAKTFQQRSGSLGSGAGGRGEGSDDALGDLERRYSFQIGRYLGALAERAVLGGIPMFDIRSDFSEGWLFGGRSAQRGISGDGDNGG